MTPSSSRRVLSHTTALMVGVILAGLGTAVSAWTGPQNSPPTCVAGQAGCDAPINVGTGSQVKNGNLSVNAFTATQNSLFYGKLGVGSSNAPTYPLEVTGTADMAAIRINGTRINSWSASLLIFADELNTSRYLMATRGTSESANANWRFMYHNTGSGTDAWPTVMSVYPTSLNATTYSVGLHDDAFTVNSSGNVVATGNITALGYFHSSDASLKKDIRTAPGLEIVKKLRGVTFDWKKDDAPSAGVIAQEVEQVMPSAVHTDPKTGLKSVEYDQLIAPLIEALKEQQVEIESLKHEVDSLKAVRESH